MVAKQDVFDPPAYEDLVPTSGGTPAANASSASPGPSSSSSAQFKTLPTPPPTATPATSPSSASWGSWSLPWNKAHNEVKENVSSLVRQIVVGIGPSSERGTEATTEALGGIMHSCADTCAKHSVSFASILQERYIEGHSPLYWAIIKQTPSRPSAAFSRDEKSVDTDIFAILLAYALPLNAQGTVPELRLACMSMSNQAAFQRLRLAAPNFSSLSSTDRILLDPSQVVESDVDVTLGSESDGGAFAVDMRFAQFHKRLMVNREVSVEFVVRNRIWKFCLMFMNYDWPNSGPKKGTWGAKLSLQDTSAPTYFDGRLILVDPDVEHGQVPPVSSSSQSATASTGVHFIRMRSPKDYRLKPSWEQSHQIGVSLEDEPAFSSLQYAESYYIPASGVLTVRLEARLTKPSDTPSDDCIIC